MASGKEKNGIEEIYEKYYKDVYRFVLALSKNPHIAEDITQETRALEDIERARLSLRLNMSTQAVQIYTMAMRSQEL